MAYYPTINTSDGKFNEDVATVKIFQENHNFTADDVGLAVSFFSNGTFQKANHEGVAFFIASVLDTSNILLIREGELTLGKNAVVSVVEKGDNLKVTGQEGKFEKTTDIEKTQAKVLSKTASDPPAIKVYVNLDSTSPFKLATTYGQKEFTTPGTFQWTCPTGVTQVSVVCVGGGGGGSKRWSNGGGGGGGLAFKNNISVTPGESYTVKVGKGGKTCDQVADGNASARGGNSWFKSEHLVCGYGAGQGGEHTIFANDNTANVTSEVSGGNNAGRGGGWLGDGGGNGGDGGFGGSYQHAGGGAGGYGGNGGSNNSAGNNGGGGSSYFFSSSNGTSGGGGVGLYGRGTNGISGQNGEGGGGGSGGRDGNSIKEYAKPGRYGCLAGGKFGGGGGGSGSTFTKSGYQGGGPGGDGGVRIIWGEGRSFPTTKCEDM